MTTPTLHVARERLDQRAWSEGLIADHVQRKFLDRKCLAVVDRCSWTGNECDLLAVTNDLRIIDVKIKISRSDFKADRRKDKWWDPLMGSHGTSPHREWPLKVWKHYLVLPEEIWSDSLADLAPSEASGILLAHKTRDTITFKCWRRAKPQKDAYRLTPENCIAVARLASLRMWDAYRRHECL